MFVGLKRVAWRAIARNRDRPLVARAARVSEFVIRAYNNEGSDLDANGERRVLEALRPFRFATALDVGANVGDWSRLATSTWDGCTVHAFEIAPETARRFREAAIPEGCKERLHLHAFGLSDVPGEVPMYYYPQSSDLTCSLPRHGDLASVPFAGTVSTVDAFCRDNHLSGVNMLKIDVEGDEFRVLGGAREYIESKAIDCIQFEYGAFSIDTKFLLKDYYAMLGERYHIGKIYPQYVEFRDYDWTMEDFRFGNFLCVLRDRPDIKLALSR